MRSKITGLFIFQVFLCLVTITLVLIPLFWTDIPWPTIARDHMENFGMAASGARNMVSAIYLGYRVFDTLGETIVLLVAVSGTIGIIAHGGDVLAKGFGDPSRNESLYQEKTTLVKKQRTALLEVVTGKLGPVVLVFGFYVMLFGHLSPGGGFQGGVVVASGIVFLALGGRADGSTRLTEAGVLAKLESISFLLLILASLSGVVFGGGFFANTLAQAGMPEVGFIVLLNAIIGLKVGAGIGFMCIAMLGRAE